MNYYFTLQFKFFNRHIKANDIHPALAWCILLGAFVALSRYILNVSEYSVYIYFLIPFIFWMGLSNSKRNAFLKTSFPTKKYRILRATENCIAGFPFCIFLLWKSHYLMVFILIILAVIFSLLEINQRGKIIIPTPFYKYPFEFSSGFRRLWPGVILSYVITFSGLLADNFNLSLFGLILINLCCVSFYTIPENKFFIWIYSMNSKRFLIHKIKIAFLHSLFLVIPIILGIVLIYPQNWWIVLAVEALGFLVVCVALLGKYTAYPSEFNLTQAIAIGFSIFLPPLLMLILPLYYWLSLKKLHPILK